MYHYMLLTIIRTPFSLIIKLNPFSLIESVRPCSHRDLQSFGRVFSVKISKLSRPIIIIVYNAKVTYTPWVLMGAVNGSLIHYYYDRAVKIFKVVWNARLFQWFVIYNMFAVSQKCRIYIYIYIRRDDCALSKYNATILCVIRSDDGVNH